MTEERIFLSSPHMSDEGYEKKFVEEAFDTNWIAPLGPNVDNFEKEFSNYIGIDNAAALSSGTAAIHLALKAAGIRQGDIVFCPTLTFAATINPVIYERAIPVFIDSGEKTWNMDAKALEQAFLKYPEVKAVIVVHLYGLSADMDAIMELCRKHKVVVIEDAAESLGTLYKAQYTGTFGDYGIYSFNGNKIITTSGGGMLVSKQQEKIEKVRFWATQSRDAARHYQHSELGYNYRMSNVLAGIGRGQLKVLDERVEKKRKIYKKYQAGLSDISEIGWMPSNEWDYANYWLSCITVNGAVTPTQIMDALEEKNIESRPIWKPMHLQPYYAKYSYIGNGFSEDLFNKGICLPSDTKMNEKQMDQVIEIIRSLYK
ncbi:DegT/DnrJ/EryC1/StrS family aminotransferase [Enterococcus sp. CWB-B31]|uniref:DegT/DnrJ/EryC1/StrS family aminotransferase n=1 Tax=Enterococcus sp. CWB-B31 TaxID=2885159 RepID=UPI001E4B062C|nr:aminotransferase class I/II-fold pyridoxal phosphate-dependent enzyme [Enterococcus sp. CWB-B31]MCB5954637.1 aminotransferase class I/II-fold pyridoxal phosphate-dependent enzyme [Enterococcus sp. CWB-B31]